MCIDVEYIATETLRMVGPNGEVVAVNFALKNDEFCIKNDGFFI